jgi:predicted kinase
MLRNDPSSDAVWHEARAVLQAGCSVLIDGVFAESAERRAAAELASDLRVTSFGFFLGSPRAGRDDPSWRTLDPALGMPAALAEATELVTTTSRSSTAAPD